jgi:hypothetical protein
MKTLQKIADKYGLQLVPIRYNYQGIPVKRKGFDLIDYQRTIYLSFEPVESTSTDGIKWILISMARHNPFFAHLKSIKSADKILSKEGFNPIGSTGNILK